MKKFPFKSASIDVEKRINLDEGIIPFILTSKTVDRDSEVILPDGGDVEEFKQNPVFLWAHNIWAPSIGRVIPETLKATTQKMTADVQFDLDDPFAAMIFNKYTKGHLNAGSIRFRPIDISNEPVLPKQKRSTIKKWKLLEFSAVPVPANPQALAQLQKGLDDIDDDRAKEWVEFLLGWGDEENREDFVQTYVKSMNTNQGDNEPEHLTTHDKHAEWLDFKHSIGIEEGQEFKQETKDAFFESEEDEGKPLPNEHACRLHDPDNYVRFRRQSRKSGGKTYFAIIGFKQGGGSEDQAYRYPKSTWTPVSAKAHCKSHDGVSFEAAKKENMADSFDEVLENLPELITIAVTEGIEKALNPLLHDEFQYKGEDGEPEWVLLANAMINLFHNKTLPDYQKRYVYDHLAGQYKQFDKKPPEFGQEPEVQEEITLPVARVYVPDEESMEKIINEVVKQVKK